MNGGDGVLDKQGNVNLTNILALIQQTQEKTQIGPSSYIAALRNVVPQVVKDTTKLKGSMKDRTLMSSINRVIFQDNPREGTFQVMIDNQIRRASQGLKTLERQKRDRQLDAPFALSFE